MDVPRRLIGLDCPLKGHEESWDQRVTGRAAIIDGYLLAVRSGRVDADIKLFPCARLRHAVVVIRSQKDGVAAISEARANSETFEFLWHSLSCFRELSKHIDERLLANGNDARG